MHLGLGVKSQKQWHGLGNRSSSIIVHKSRLGVHSEEINTVFLWWNFDLSLLMTIQLLNCLFLSEPLNRLCVFFPIKQVTRLICEFRIFPCGYVNKESQVLEFLCVLLLILPKKNLPTFDRSRQVNFYCEAKQYR